MIAIVGVAYIFIGYYFFVRHGGQFEAIFFAVMGVTLIGITAWVERKLDD